MSTERERAWLRLHLTRGIGRRRLFDLLTVFKTPEAALQAAPEHWPAGVGTRRTEPIHPLPEDAPEVQKALAVLDGCGARIISFWDAAYPELLKSIHDPPALLYVRGRLSPRPALAVVGSRRASAGGRALTRSLSHELAAAGFSIVSGLARGVDSAAHEGALDAGGETIAVLGCGIDRIYPPENSRLYLRIVEQGAVISEHPPGTEPLPGHFPGRNRIISGLSDGVLIVEAAAKSGSLITAEFALEQGREVFAVPGAVASPTSGGVNRLLKDGAHLVTEPRDVLDILRPGSMPVKSARATGPEPVDETERSLVELITGDPVQVDDLARKSGLTPMELSAILLQLELRGVVSQLPGMRYIRCLPP